MVLDQEAWVSQKSGRILTAHQKHAHVLHILKYVCSGIHALSFIKVVPHLARGTNKSVLTLPHIYKVPTMCSSAYHHNAQAILGTSFHSSSQQLAKWGN